MIKATVTINPEINMGVLAGIITGLVAGTVYNRQADIKLPDFLSLSGSKRFVSITAGFSCLVLAAIFGYVWPSMQRAIHSGGEQIVSAGALGLGISGFVSRLLIPTSPHQVLNAIVWFQIGGFINVASAVLHSDINRSYAGDSTVGMFMFGSFLIMMFGLPGATLVMYLVASKARRPMVDGILLSVAIIVFLIRVTEPLEFLSVFLAPLLYPLYAVLAGISLFIITALGIHTGFSFPAGAVDYVLIYNLPAASKDIWVLLMMSVVFFPIYFLLFSAVICMLNLKTPGREDKAADMVTEEVDNNIKKGLTQLAASYVTTVGRTDNPKATDACIARLRLTVGDLAKVNGAACKRLDASGVVKLSKQTARVIAGTRAESIGDEMKRVVTRGPVMAATVVPVGNVVTIALTAKPQAVTNMKAVELLVSPITGDMMALEQVSDGALASKAVDDGIMVKPTNNVVVASAAGTVVKTFNTNHAFCLETSNGTEIVVHMGIDTVALEGRGSKCLAEGGTGVKANEPILEMDLDLLSVNARSMISPVVCSNSDDYSALMILASGKVAVGQTPLYGIKGK